jgi:hypothetical protein
MARSGHRTELSPRPVKRRAAKPARQGRKRATARPKTKFKIRYFRKRKRAITLRFDLSSLEQARKVGRVAGEFADAAVHSFRITSADGRTETWSYRDGAWRQKRK